MVRLQASMHPRNVIRYAATAVLICCDGTGSRPSTDASDDKVDVIEAGREGGEGPADVKAGDAISCGNGDSVDACGPSCLQCPSDPPLGSATCILGVCGLQCMRSAGVVDGMCVPDP